MGFFRTVFIVLLIYWIFKAFQRIVAPFFAGYYNAESGKTGAKSQQTKMNNIIIDTSKAKTPLTSKPNINRIDAEEVDFEEIK